MHENLTKLHNFTVNNRLKQSAPSNIQHPPSTTNAKRGQNYAFENGKSSRKSRERSSIRKSDNQGGYRVIRGMSAERESDLLANHVPEIDREKRKSRFNSTESRRKSSGNRY